MPAIRFVESYDAFISLLGVSRRLEKALLRRTKADVERKGVSSAVILQNWWWMRIHDY